jgi:hypothetical protein
MPPVYGPNIRVQSVLLQSEQQGEIHNATYLRVSQDYWEILPDYRSLDFFTQGDKYGCEAWYYGRF